MFTLDQIAPGDEIIYETFTGSLRFVTVTEVLADVKNGRPGFDAIFTDPAERRSSFSGGAVWGYLDQIISIERKAVQA